MQSKFEQEQDKAKKRARKEKTETEKNQKTTIETGKTKILFSL